MDEDGDPASVSEAVGAMECVELETTESEKAYGTDKCPCGCHWSPDQLGSESEGGIVQNPHCIHCSVRVSSQKPVVLQTIWPCYSDIGQGTCEDVLSIKCSLLFQFIGGKVFIKDGKVLKPASVEYPEAASIHESRMNASKKSAKTTTIRRPRLKSNTSSGQ